MGEQEQVDRSARGGMTNADFARIFRQEARSSAESVSASVPHGADNTSSARNDDNDERDEQPAGFRGLGFQQSTVRELSDAQPSGFQGLDFHQSTGRQESDTQPAGSRGLGFQQSDAQSTSSRGLGFQQSSTQQQSDTQPAAAPAAPKREAPAMSKAQLANLGKWEKHTKGFGMKMLAKMGFKGRLGKDEQGVSATVEVVQRPALMGIGFGNFTEASALKHNRKLQRELKGETVDDEAARKQKEADALLEDDSLWRKRKAPVGGAASKKYKRAADVRQDAQSSKRPDVVLDMRGPSVRVLSSVSDAYAVDAQRLAAAKPKLGDELIYNVRMVVNVAQSQIVDLTSKVEQNTEAQASLAKEAAIIKAQVAMETVRLQHVETMMQRMQALAAAADAARSSCDVRGVVELLTEIRSASPQEFEAYKLHQVVASLCVPALKALLTGCDLADCETQRTVVAQYRVLQVFLLHVPSTRSGDSSTTGAVFHSIHEKVNSAGEDTYNYILEETLWPAMSQFVTYQWRVCAAPDECIALLELVAPHLSQAFDDALVHQLVLPRLKKECQRWHPQRDAGLQIHDWLLPWRPVLGRAIEALYPDTRLALANALSQWHPSDNEPALALLAPWRAVWGEHEYAKFTHRHVVRKLVRCLHRDFEINPAKQSLEALEWVLAWRAHLPERQLVALLEGEFFPMWLSVLRQWVASDAPSLRELETWYRGWKRFFEKQALAQHQRLVVHFHGALVLLDAACERFAMTQDSDGATAVCIPRLNRNAPSSYQDALVQARAEDPTAEDGVSSAADDTRMRTTAAESASAYVSEKKRVATHAVGLKDVIENLAIAHNVTFLPKGEHDGQQVYVFGSHHIVIDQGVVFAEKRKGSFEPVDIEQLL